MRLAVLVLILTAAAVHAAQEFQVDAFSGTDDRDTINKAFAAMRAVRGAKKLTFSTRTYRVSAPDTDTFQPVLDLSAVEDLVVDGNGAVIAATQMLGVGKGYLLACRSFARVTIRDLRITFDPRPSVQGRIMSVDQSVGTVEVELSPGFDHLGLLQAHAASELWCRVGQKGAAHLPKPGSPSWLRVASRDGQVWREHLGGARYRLRCGGFKIDETIHGRHVWEAGDPLVIWQRGAQDALAAWDGKDLALTGIVIDSALHFAFKVRGVDGVEVVRCRVEPPPGGMISGSADGIDIQQSRRVLISDCRVVANGDDAISLLNHGHGLNGTRHEQRFAAPLPDTNEDVRIISNHLEGGNRNGILALAERCEIRANTLRDIRQYGVKCTGDDAVIEGNRFERIGIFTAFRHIADELDTGIICSDEWIQRRWRIRGNSFLDWWHMPAILLKSVQGAEIEGNRFEMRDPEAQRAPSHNPYLQRPVAICLTTGRFRGVELMCEEIRLGENRLLGAVEALVANGQHRWSGVKPAGR